MAELKRMYDNQDDIPEEHRDFYIERDGNFVLNLTGTDPYSKPIDEHNRVYRAMERERQQREELQKRLDAITGKLGDIDDDKLDAIHKSLQEADDAEHKRLLDAKQFEEAAEQKYRRQMAELNRKISQLEESSKLESQKANNLLEKYRSVKIHDSLRSAFIEAGADPKKIDWIVKAESEKWEMNPDTYEPEPIDWIDGGQTKVTATGADGNPLTFKEHAKGIMQEHPWVALNSSGSQSSHQTASSTNGSYQIRKSIVNGPGGTAEYRRIRDLAQKAGQEIQIIDG